MSLNGKIMINKKFKKLIPALLVILILCCIIKINLYDNTYTDFDTQENSDIQSLASHFKPPPNIKGKQLPFHQVYEPRQIGFPSDLRNNTNFNTTKIILLWNQWNGLWETINYYFLLPGSMSFLKYNCPNSKCFTTHDRKYLEKADAVLFHLPDIKASDLPQKRKNEQLWILYNMEGPWLIKRWVYSELKHLKNLFNWTMSYRSDSTIISRYGFIKSYARNKSSIPIPKKTKSIVWFVSDCKTDSKREEYANELKKYIDVDIYGTCGDHKCYPSQSAVCYEQILEKYKFYLSFENCICKDYTTEKFFNIFNYDIIPIVYGGANYTSIAPEGTFIDATKFPDPKLLADTLQEISNNEDMYERMLMKKRTYTAYLDPWMCRLCDSLHSGGKNSVLQDVEEWWINEARCKTWNKSALQFVDVQ